MEPTELVFTVGHRGQYLHCLNEYNGKMQKSVNGSVWRTREEAQAYLDRVNLRPYAVFGVAANWEQDTVAVEGAEWHALKVEADIVVLEDKS